MNFQIIVRAANRRCVLLIATAWITGLVGGLWPPPIEGQVEPENPKPPAPWLVDVAQEAGLDFIQRSGGSEQQTIADVKACGVSILDYNSDGRPDLFFTQGSSIERACSGQPGYGGRLFRNDGSMKFSDVTDEAGIPPLGWSTGCAAADIDDDGDDDLLVTAISEDRLFRNDDGIFVDITDQTDLDSTGWSAGAAFGDLDGDGDLDLFITRYLSFDVQDPPMHGEDRSCLWKDQVVLCGPRGLNALFDSAYENLGNGEFRNATTKWGFDETRAEYGLGVVICDLDGDETNEVFVANDSSPNHLWKWDGERYRERGFSSGVSVDLNGEEQAGMGIDTIDVDGDLDLDLFVTNFADERNNLYVMSKGFFFDDAQRFGLGAASQKALSWGAGFRDFNGDGLLDLYVANGHVYPEAGQVSSSGGYTQVDDLYVGRMDKGQLRFDKQNLLHSALRGVGRAVAFADLDGDLDTDVVVANLNERPFLLCNRTPTAANDGNRRVQLVLEQAPPNRQAIGALVDIEVGAMKRRIPNIRHGSFQTTHGRGLEIGLGQEAAAGHAIVRWPNGDRERFSIPTRSERLLFRKGGGKTVESAVPSPASGSTEESSKTEPANSSPNDTSKDAR